MLAVVRMVFERFNADFEMSGDAEDEVEEGLQLEEGDDGVCGAGNGGGLGEIFETNCDHTRVEGGCN